MELQKLQQIGGICTIGLALIYITTFIYYGAFLVFPEINASPETEIQFLTDHHIGLSTINLISYVLFGILLAIVALALYERTKKETPTLSKLSFIFGILWVSLVIASGMITNIGLSSVIEMGQTQPEKAMTIWSSINIVTEGLGGGNEIVGGIWVLMIAIIGFNTSQFPKFLNILGIIVGVAGILTIYPIDLFTEVFGLSQILWFLWIGIYLIRISAHHLVSNTN